MALFSNGTDTSDAEHRRMKSFFLEIPVGIPARNKQFLRKRLENRCAVAASRVAD
jgi:hypothetical protein